MATYETVFITLPNLSEDEERTVVSGFAQVLQDAGGTMAYQERMGRRRLAYPIQKMEDGVYTRFLYDAAPEVPKEVERRMRISDKVLRHLTVRLDRDWAVAAKEQAIRDAQAREEAEARRAAAIAAGLDPDAPLPEEGAPARPDAEVEEMDDEGGEAVEADLREQE